MASRGHYNQSTDWESQNEYSSSVYDQQYLEDNADDGLDHCRLYIRNVPKALNEEGLRAAFAKFGTLLEVFVSKNPEKNFALIRYESPGEAKLAMMKMNRTEPLKMTICIAQKSKSWQGKNATSVGRSQSDKDRSISEGSITSRGRMSRVQDETNGDNNMDELMMEGDYGFSDILDSNLHLELENLKLEQLKVREEQLACKQKLILLKQAERKPALSQLSSNRCILPDGKIMVRNVESRDSRDADVIYSAGAGDSRVAVRQCVVCGNGSDAFCAGCGITPYCSEPCQRRDWQHRHRAVCHNLARLNNDNARAASILQPSANNEPSTPPTIQPLRRPYGNTSNNKREFQNRDNSSDERNASFTSKASVKSGESNNRDDQYNNAQERQRRPFHQKTYNQKNNEGARATTSQSPKKETTNTQGNRFNKKASAPLTPKNEEPVNNQHNQVNGAQAPARKPELVKPAAPVKARQRIVVPTTSVPEPSTAKPEAAKLQEAATPTKETEPIVVRPAKPQEAATPQTETESIVVTPTVKPANPQKADPPPKETEPIVVTPTTMGPGSLSDVTPTRKKVVPKNYLLEKLSVGDSLIMSVDAKAPDCRITRGDYVCLTMAEAFEQDYHSLCEDFVLDCNKDDQPAKLTPGETVSFFNPEDCGWYRARVLNPTTLALLDSGRIVSVTAADKCRKLPSKYEVMPEFCCVLSSKAVELGVSLNCKIESQTPSGYMVSMIDVETNASVGEGEVFRWSPTVEYQAPGIPEVARPPLTNGSKVLLVLADTLDVVFVRPSDSDSQQQYNDVLQQVLLSAMKGAKPLTEPPTPGQTVIGKFVDDCYYRALVRRVNVKLNKYQIEYAEYGNIEVSTLENLYACPAEFDLSTVKTLVSVLKLAPPTEMSDAAKEFIKELEAEELVLTLPNGLKSAPSGSEASLTITKSRVDLGAQLVAMCTPNWKKIEQRGGDVAFDTEPIMFQDIEYAELPESGCTIEVLDISVLKGGALCGYDHSDTKADTVYNKLTAKMAEYCNSEVGREPYLPKPEELCIAQLPPYPQWFRAVFLNLVNGPGSSEAKVCYLDYGNVASVPVSLIRKMMPEFIVGIPVMGLYLDIRDFPKDPSDDWLARAVHHMNIDEEGRGTLKVTKCEKTSDGMYCIDAPELMLAMQG